MKTFYTLLLLVFFNLNGYSTTNIQKSLDSLYLILNEVNSDENRLEVLHHACNLLYKQDSDHERLIKFAAEGVELAQLLEDTDKGADLAVWILRSNIYLRSYERNPPFYAYLKNLYLAGKIEQSKYIHPLYSEIYSYIDYGKLKEAEKKMGEFEQLIDKENHKQHSYYLDLYIAFKRKLKENKDASIALDKFAFLAKELDDPRFIVYALSRNSSFYLEDSLDYQKSKYYALEALAKVKENDLTQLKSAILLQLAKAHYKLEDYRSFKSIFSKIAIDESIVNDKILAKDYYTFSGDLQYNDGEYNLAIENYKKSVQYLEHSDFSSMEHLTKKIEKAYVKLDNFKAAYKYANRLNVLQDSLYNEENLKAIKVFESRLKYKDIETERIKLENKIQAQKRSTIFIGFFSSLILLSLVLYNRILDEKVKIRTLALNTKNKELKSSLEELEQFNYVASHDIKEPMRVVSSVTGLIEKKLEKIDQNKFQSEFSLVKNSISQLYTLIEDMSQFLNFKSKTITHQMVDTQTLVSQITQMLGKTVQEKNALVTFENLPKIYSSNSLLTVVFKNLIENGMKYNESEVPTVNISYKMNNGRHYFSVKDNGIGIDKKYHDYIFQMFKRLHHRDKKGSGLGLGLVLKSIEKLDGEIILNSSEGNGSDFTFTLPQSYLVSQN